MVAAGNSGVPQNIVKSELSTLSNNITNCLLAVSLKVGSDKETLDCAEECVIAAEELKTLGELVKADIKAVADSLTTIKEQVDQLEKCFQTVDRLERFVKEVLLGITRHNDGYLVLLTAPDFVEGDSEDDLPVETSSKVRINVGTVPTTKKLKGRKNRRRHRVVKVNALIVLSRSSTFKVVPLSVSPPPPAINFRANLLKERTKSQRVSKTEYGGLQHKKKWFRMAKMKRS
ncbi:unnamed protein product [Thelazia callipaeda]|uniref:Uncharacterized protein n=1 Tax=Thelazia callipaeda TaxID=103827 RepID=A0A0N5CPU3_THECL|nr:unnamed protein product [Thelazia callipaeda]